MAPLIIIFAAIHIEIKSPVLSLKKETGRTDEPMQIFMLLKIQLAHVDT